MASFMYKYTPLDLATDTIRLVCLLKGSFNDDIRCELWESQLHRDDVPYEALSYTWGGTEKSAKIFLDGCMAQVTHNLDTALRYLRLEDQDRIIWIDAICIDQDNERERGHQVGQMKRIYQNAEKVLICSVKDFKSFYEDLSSEESGLYKRLLAREQRLSPVAGSLFRPEYSEIDVNMDYPDIGTPLSFLAEKGRHEVVETILARNDADINLGSPPDKAAGMGHDAIVRLLLARNDAEINLGSPLASAAENGHDAIVRLLLARNDADINLGSPLASAAVNGHERVVSLLLENGADKESQDFNGRTPLSRAALKGYERVVRLLLENGAAMESRDNDGRTPLSQVMGKGYERVVTLLLDKGASVDSRDNRSRTSLSWAAGRGSFDEVKLLLENGADKESRDTDGRAPLSWAAGRTSLYPGKFLLYKGAAMESRDNDGRTPLSWAAGEGACDGVQLLLENGADMESRDINGRTPLSWAAGNGRKLVVRLLLENGAAMESRDNDGRTPLSWAEGNTAGGDATSLIATKRLLDRGVKSGSENEERYKAAWQSAFDVIKMRDNTKDVWRGSFASFQSARKAYPDYRIDAETILHFGPLARILLASEMTRDFHFVGMPPGTIFVTPVSSEIECGFRFRPADT
ncbi:hypothetical protein DL770_004030 [Monosporascus sp. CRB-9-2]|nr:hypothetical protein DL770_004030 [Monosporascus sp. CRB-9-2]